MNKYPGRISKKQAKELWKKGEPFVIVPCRCYPYVCNPMGVVVRYKVSEFAFEVKREFYQNCDTDFDKLCNSFTYYNCNAVTGYYPAFYRLHPDKYER